jgi:hypothetical protein
MNAAGHSPFLPSLRRFAGRNLTRVRQCVGLPAMEAVSDEELENVRMWTPTVTY